VSELLFGEDFDLFDIARDAAGDWGFGRTATDRYTGWVAMAALGDPGETPTHRISAPVAPVFSAADIKAPVLRELPFGAHLAGEAGKMFLALSGGGFVHLHHLSPPPATPLEVARLFTGAPYLWGGRTPMGVDCSGLVQAALVTTGRPCPRDSDQQLAALGTAVAFEDRAPGDLVFFPGHVGILAGRDRLFHANAHWMATVEEPLDDVIARLAASGVETPVSGVRRLA
jgi:cell wall-associated NlpC family hydrolase